MTDLSRLHRLLALKEARLRLSRQKLAHARRSEAGWALQLDQAAVQQSALQQISDDYVRSRLADSTLRPSQHASGAIFEGIALGNAIARGHVTQITNRMKRLEDRLDHAAVLRRELVQEHLKLENRTTVFTDFVVGKIALERTQREDAAEEDRNEEASRKDSHGPD